MTDLDFPRQSVISANGEQQSLIYTFKRSLLTLTNDRLAAQKRSSTEPLYMNKVTLLNSEFRGAGGLILLALDRLDVFPLS